MNKRRLIKLILCLGLLVMTLSCGVNNKESYLKSFEEFIVEIENVETFSIEEQTSIKKEYLDLTETYYNKFKDDLSNADEALILELKARYYTVMAKQGLKDVGEDLKDLGEQASEFINEILE